MPRYPDHKLSDKEEHYAQLRASGYTQTKACQIAYDTAHPDKMGNQIEQRDRVKRRIRELKEELAEISGITFEGQAAKYHELYLEARANGDIKNAIAILQRIDTLAGLDVKRSVVEKKSTGESLKDKDGDTSKDLDKFSTLLGKHSEDTSSNSRKTLN